MATEVLEKQDAHEQEAKSASLDGRWTVEALYQAIDAGEFWEPERLELVQGRIVEKMAQDPIHRAMRVRIADRLKAAAMPSLVVIEECPVRLAYDTELTPDVVLLHGVKADYDDRHPESRDAAVIVEVSNTTMTRDLGEKAMQYAQAEVQEYWVVLVKENAVVVHRQPSPAGYQDVTRLAGTDALSPLALPETVWTVDALLGKKD